MLFLWVVELVRLWDLFFGREEGGDCWREEGGFVLSFFLREGEVWEKCV